ncbi:transcription elongation factor GreA [Streptacidiphilus sp. MAP12-33]|uniref:GreA/GreB family elongation factor n=1 Tax=Streptacidiphilus sp. MAP12-33 TaxID=3156266 RepID=UPI0035159348
MSSEPEPISLSARRALEQELADLREERRAAAETLGVTDSAGDRADQADELQRATDVARLDARIDAVHLRLRQAAEAGPPRQDEVGVGSTVTVRFGDGTTQTLHVGVVANEADEALVTSDSPLGLALLGHRAGDDVTYRTPTGQAAAVIVSIGDSG